MADYGLTVLQRVSVHPHCSEPLPMHDSTAGRAFGAQDPVVEETGDVVRVYLPVTVRGDRLGVLSVTLPSETAATMPPELTDIAGGLGHQVLVAWRGTGHSLQ